LDGAVECEEAEILAFLCRVVGRLLVSFVHGNNTTNSRDGRTNNRNREKNPNHVARSSVTEVSAKCINPLQNPLAISASKVSTTDTKNMFSGCCCPGLAER